MKQRATTDTMTFNQTMGKLWDELIERGPQPTKELNADTGKVPYPTRLAGLTNFRPTTSTNGGAVSGGGHKLTIYYIEGEHTPRQVVEAWFEANPHTVETHTKHALTHRMAKYGSEYAAAVLDILDETDNSEPHATGNTGPTAYGACPICDEDLSGSLASHLPDCTGTEPTDDQSPTHQ
jgi:hypothetical protein